MRRKITKEEMINLINKIREELPGIALRTTFLVGHPGETEDDFEELKAFVAEQKFDRMGVFAYSDEDDTYAFKMYEEDIKQERAAELMELQQNISEKMNTEKVGNTLNVFIDREEADYFIGRTEFDSPEVDGEVLVEKNDDIKIGHFHQIKISDSTEFNLIGHFACSKKSS